MVSSKNLQLILITCFVTLTIAVFGGGVWWWMSGHENKVQKVDAVPLQESPKASQMPPPSPQPIPSVNPAPTASVPALQQASVPVTAPSAPIPPVIATTPIVPPHVVVQTHRQPPPPKKENTAPNQERDKAVLDKTNKTLDDLLK